MSPTHSLAIRPDTRALHALLDVKRFSIGYTGLNAANCAKRHEREANGTCMHANQRQVRSMENAARIRIPTQHQGTRVTRAERVDREPDAVGRRLLRLHAKPLDFDEVTHDVSMEVERPVKHHALAAPLVKCPA